MRGTTLKVTTRRVSYDEHGEEVETSEVMTVEDVLVAAGSTSDNMTDAHDGERIAYTLCFPKSFTASLAGASVEIDGEEFTVVGDPRPQLLNCPTRWNRPVSVVRSDG